MMLIAKVLNPDDQAVSLCHLCYLPEVIPFMCNYSINILLQITNSNTEKDQQSSELKNKQL